MNIIKNKSIDLLSLKTEDEILNKKIEFILKIILDSEYYIIYINSLQLKSIKILLNYYKYFVYDSKKEEIKELEIILNTKKINVNIKNIKNFLKDLETAKIMNIRKPIINYLLNVKLKDEKFYNKVEFEKILNTFEWENLEKMIKDKKIKNMRKDLKNALIHYFNDINNKEILLQIFDKDVIEFFIQKTKEKNQNIIKSVKSKESNNKDLNTDLISKDKNITIVSCKLFIKLILINYR